jgi:predicted GH43/DUF377 family glycosyl hydrolase
MKSICFILSVLLCSTLSYAQSKQMMYGDTTRRGVPYSKDPHVVFFKGKYLMYYTIPSHSDRTNPVKGVGIGIARSENLIDWQRVGELTPVQECEANGFCAPCARVIDDKVHLFYQIYGHGKNDAICHAASSDGITFERDASNPVFKPSGNWTCGRAIDAEIILYQGNYLMYYATRDPDFKIQMQGVARASANTDFSRGQWINLSMDKPILAPELPWEEECVEGASVIEREGKLYMFYAGAYNNRPQQIGVAVSEDGMKWTRLSEEPFLRNGKKGEWNSSESGHPHIFKTPDGRTFLFFQGNNDNGKTWYISNKEIFWKDGLPSFDK